ncbi:MAG: hypothetical protein ACXQS8_06705 [Candidatus Helarchaeales archaeon]
MSNEEIRRVLARIDHFEKDVPFTNETVDRLVKWFNDYDLHCCCVPYTKKIFETNKMIEKVIDDAPEASFSLLYHDPLGMSSVSFIKTMYDYLLMNNALEVYEAIEIVAPVHLLKSWRLDEYETAIQDILFGISTEDVKIIIQTPMLVGFEIKAACEICVKNGVDVVKTGTGYFGITLPKHISWMRDAIDCSYSLWRKAEDYDAMPTLLKAAGGIMDLTMVDLAFDLGADIIGMSRTAKVIEEIKRSV